MRLGFCSTEIDCGGDFESSGGGGRWTAAGEVEWHVMREKERDGGAEPERKKMDIFG